jgi:hypothetical protein
MTDKIDVTPEGVERLAAYHDWRDDGDSDTANLIRALSARLAEVEADVVEWKRQALYHNAEHGKLVVIQCETEAQLARAVEALQCARAIFDTPIGRRRLGLDEHDERLVVFRATLAKIGEGHE